MLNAKQLASNYTFECHLQSICQSTPDGATTYSYGSYQSKPISLFTDAIHLRQYISHIGTIHRAKISSQPLHFLKLDFSKPYDKIDLEFLFKAMVKLGFPNDYIQMTKLLFKNAQVNISINRQCTQSSTLAKGSDKDALWYHIFFLLWAKSSSKCLRWMLIKAK